MSTGAIQAKVFLLGEKSVYTNRSIGVKDAHNRMLRSSVQSDREPQERSQLHPVAFQKLPLLGLVPPYHLHAELSNITSVKVQIQNPQQTLH